MKLIGLSLSSCVQDILNGSVQLQEITAIVSNTKLVFTKEVMECGYRNTWWKDFETDKILEVLEVLKPITYQPRQTDKNYQHNIADGNWLQTDLEITELIVQLKEEYDQLCTGNLDERNPLKKFRMEKEK